VDSLFHLVYPLPPGETDEGTATLEEIARQFPTMPVVFAQALFPRFDEASRLLDSYDNVWIELTQVFGNFFDARYVLKEYPSARELLRERLWPDFIARIPKKPRASGR